MRAGRSRRKLLVLVAILGVTALVSWLDRREGASDGGSVPVDAAPQVGATTPVTGRSALVVRDVTVRNYGDVVFRGDVDLAPTLERIRAGRSFPHRNDGGVFQNREGRLPSRPRGYYREYVHPTPGIDGPGPQRVVVGDAGELYYTADHYQSFVRLEAGGT